MAKKDKQQTPEAPELDAETQRILDEMAEQDKAAIVEQKKAEAPPPLKAPPVMPNADEWDGQTVTNRSRNKHSIAGTVVLPGASYFLTDQDRNDERLMTKVNYAIKIGVLGRGAN